MLINFWWWRAESEFDLLHTQSRRPNQRVKPPLDLYPEATSRGKRSWVLLLKPSFWWIMCSWRLLCIQTWTVAAQSTCDSCDPHLPIDVSNFDSKSQAEKGTLALKYQKIYPLVICYSLLLKMAQLQLIYLSKMVVLSSYVSLPEGINQNALFVDPELFVKDWPHANAH